jgi:hypothetical protein
MVPLRGTFHFPCPPRDVNSRFCSYDQSQTLAQPAQYHTVRRIPEDKTTPLCCFEIAYRTANELRALGIVPAEILQTPTGPETGRTVRMVSYGVVSPIQGQSYGMSL